MADGGRRVREGVTKEAEVSVMCLPALMMKEEATHQGLLVASSGWGRQGGESLLEPPEGSSPADMLILEWRGPFWTSDFQNCKIIILFCLKPLSLEASGREAIGN